MFVLLVAVKAGFLQVLLVFEGGSDELTEHSIHVAFAVREKTFEEADVSSV